MVSKEAIDRAILTLEIKEESLKLLNIMSWTVPHGTYEYTRIIREILTYESEIEGIGKWLNENGGK